MSNPEKQLHNLLRDNRFQLVRQTHHKVYRNHEGKVFVTSLTPSDYRWSQNALTTLKKVLSSPPVPEVVAISEFERQQAAAVIQPHSKEPGPGHTKQKSNGGGTGFTYIDKVQKEVVSMIPPEQKLAEKIQHQWESAVRRARHEFVESIVSKAKPWIMKSDRDDERQKQEAADRYLQYVNTGLRKDIELDEQYFKNKAQFCENPTTDPCHCSWCKSKWYQLSGFYRTIATIAHRHDNPDELYHDMVAACPRCEKKETENDIDFRLCSDHRYDRYRKVALNINRYLPKNEPITRDDVAREAKIMFQRAIEEGEKFWPSWEKQISINHRLSGEILQRFALRKLRPIVEELVRQRPQKPQSISEAA